MAVNLNIILILYLSSAITVLICALLMYLVPKTKKIHSLFYIRLGMIFISLSLILDAISAILLNKTFAILSGISIIPAVIFFSIGINYILKETYISIHLIVISCLSALLCYFAFQPNAVKQIKMEGLTFITWIGLFGLISDILTLIIFVQIFYWGLNTWRNAPFLIKKEALIFFLGIILITVFPFIVLIFRISNPLLANILIYLFCPIGIVIISYAIIREPKILYVLPFTIYRILVKDKEGYLLFDHDWSESNISEVMFTGFINAVQVMSEEVMNIGGLVDINLEEGILILHESKSITVGLVSSKSSKLLRDTLLNFSKDFEQQFERELKQKIRDTSKYETAYLLIDKHFSNFPFRIIPSKRHSLLLSGKYAKVPLEIDNKLKDIFTDENEYEAIKAEIIKSPGCIPEEFLNLYEDLKNEKEQLPEDSSKKIDNKKT